MKIKLRSSMTVKKAVRPSPAEVDALAVAYEHAKRSANEFKNTAEKQAEAIKSLARQRGVTRGKSTLVEGHKYQAGFLVAEMSPVIDGEKLKAALPPKIWGTLLSCSLDNAKLERAVRQGTVSKKLFLRCLVSRPPQERVVVKLISRRYETAS